MKKSTLKRMLELSDIKPVIKESKMSHSNFELVKSSSDGKSYAIVREGKKYHIKETETRENLKESDFDYVGGYMNKTKKSFNSFSDATRHLNLMFEEINNHYDVKSTNILESDDILSEKKFVLKLNKKKKTKEDNTEMKTFRFCGSYRAFLLNLFHIQIFFIGRIFNNLRRQRLCRFRAELFHLFGSAHDIAPSR